MPAVYAHYSFGEKVLDSLPHTLAERFSRFHEAFALGTQGPDILFYHRPLKKNPTRQKGSDMHFAAAESFFSRQAKRLTNENHVTPQNGAWLPRSAEAAYVAGFICHFALDVYAHPIVYELQSTGVSHGKIESEFDKYLLRKDDKPVRGYNTAQFAVCRNGTAEACANVLDVTTEEIRLAVKTIRKINGWFSQKHETFHVLAHTALKLVGLDEKFGDMFLRKHDDPRCETCNLRLNEALQSAVPFTATLLTEYFSRISEFAAGERLNDFFQNNYTGGPM